MHLFREAGLGGVEISPVYGVTGPGEPDRYVPHRSPEWTALLAATLREARAGGMGADMILGTGWPWGGPQVGPADAAARAEWQTFLPKAASGEPLQIRSKTHPDAALMTLMAFGPDGDVRDLTAQVGPERNLEWSPPGAGWTLYAVFLRGTGQKVKRAAPGGEGLTVDPFSAEAVQRYLRSFDATLAALPADAPLRGVFNDSYEVYGADTTATLFSDFRRLRGYDLRRYLPALFGAEIPGGKLPDMRARVRADYRETISDLLRENLASAWTRWARARNLQTRYQAHGSPGNLLDLYAEADIPETETFGTAWLDRSRLDPLPGTPRRHGAPDEVLVCKLASSAAHVAGKRLCSSETCTWLGEHGKVPLEHMKAEIDTLFAIGINHIIYQGTPLSPARAPWPGWLFYASTHIGPTNPFWRDLPALSDYVARCQAFLQAGEPDNDLLLYLPIHDLWAQSRDPRELLPSLTVHNTDQWMDQGMPGFAKAGRLLWDRGYGFDCISDRQIRNSLSVSGGRLQANGHGGYRALILPDCRHMDPETLGQIVALAQQGASVIVLGALPQDVPGLNDYQKRLARLESLRNSLGRGDLREGVVRFAVGKGALLLGPELSTLLERSGCPREVITDQGVRLLRRRDGDSRIYFLVNQGAASVEGWVPLAAPARSVARFDPARGRNGLARIRRSRGGAAEVYLQLAPGESTLLRTVPAAVGGHAWIDTEQAAAPVTLTGPWNVKFVAGGPQLPAPVRRDTLGSWTDWPEQQEALRAFSGTARYTLRFTRPRIQADLWELELGAVCHSAHIWLNGTDLGRVYARPWRMPLGDALREGENRLEIEVTNLMANRLADLDRRKVPWRNFFFVTIAYQSFDASGWEPLPSGLLGPVRLLPLHRIAGPGKVRTP